MDNKPDDNGKAFERKRRKAMGLNLNGYGRQAAETGFFISLNHYRWRLVEGGEHVMLAGIAVMIFAIAFTLFVHEAGHMAAIVLTRAGKVQGMVVCLKGIGVKWEPFGHEPFKRSVVSFAGSGVNLALAVIFYSAGLDLFGMANLVFGLVNLLPLPGADGLRAFNSLKEAVS